MFISTEFKAIPQIPAPQPASSGRWFAVLPALAALAVALSVSGDLPQMRGSFEGTDANGSTVPTAAMQVPQGAPPTPMAMDFLEIPQDRARRLNAVAPFSTAPNPAARPFRFIGDEASRLRAIDCLASAQYYEAGGDLEGQRAVAQVVLNRARHPAFPSTVCGVVYQGSERTTGCQFTFTCDGALARHPLPWLWDKTREIARQALDGSVYAKVGLATHYHTDWVLPVWSGSLDKITSVHTHLFFRWRGGWGQPGAFLRTGNGVEPFEPELAILSPYHQLPEGQQDAALAQAGTGPAAADPGADTTLASASLAGVDLRGSTLRLVHPQGDAFGFLMPHAFPGAFGLMALDVCRGRSFCKVMGWTDASAIPKGFPIPYEAQRKMAFLYVRDSTRRGEILAWNCDIFPRRNPEECLSNQNTQWDAVQHTANAAAPGTAL